MCIFVNDLVQVKDVSYLVDGRRQLSVLLEIHVGAGVHGVLVLLLSELEGEQGVLAPGDVLLDVDLILKG